MFVNASSKVISSTQSYIVCFIDSVLKEKSVYDYISVYKDFNEIGGFSLICSVRKTINMFKLLSAKLIFRRKRSWLVSN